MNTAAGCGHCGSGAVSSICTPASINGVALQAMEGPPGDEALRQRAWSELLRQEAVRQGLLPAHSHTLAPALSVDDQRIIQEMLERSVQVPAPSEAECRRYFEARPTQFIAGAMVHARHILFAVTGGVDVHKLVARAEQALLELSRKEVAPGRFTELARQLSNCPSGADGGDLGWITPENCAGELATELFHATGTPDWTGLRPRLVHSRYGFHIVEVLARAAGRQLPFEEVRGRIELLLRQRVQARALHQYMQLLAGQAAVAGVMLSTADSPLVQ